jgi:hypothetical protein
MAWSAFFGVVMGAYAVYYVLNFLYDLFFSRQQKAPADARVHYGMEELTDEEEGYDLSQEETEDDDPYEDDLYEEEGEEAEQPYEQEEGSRAPAPALRVEGQGIPLEEFLKEAKTYSSSIF